MIHDIKKVYENTIRQGKAEGDKKEYICRIYKYLVSPKSSGVKENTYICYFEEIGKNQDNNDNNKSVKSEKRYSSEKIKEMIECALEKMNLEEIEVIIRRKDKKNEDLSKYSTNIEELWSSDLEVITKRNN